MVIDPTTGERLRVFDVHHHLSADEGPSMGTPLGLRMSLMDKHGIDRACLLAPSGAYGRSAESTTQVNDRVASAVAAHPDRFPTGVAHIELAEGEEACVAEMRRTVDDLGLRGCVWHHRFQGTFIDHPLMVPLLEVAAELGVPAFVHVVEGSTLEAPWRLQSLLRAVPEATVVALDGFTSVDRAGELTAMAEVHPNLYCDLGAMSSVAGYMVERFVRQVGADRLLLGTNLYVSPVTYRVPFPLVELLELDLTIDDKRAILCANAETLLSV